MSNDKSVSNHYSHGDLLNAIQASLAKLGKTTASVTVEDLAPVDEFHIGGRLASEHFLGQLNFSEEDHVLDVGCGLGGASRYVANTCKSRVTGIDLTQEYIDAGNALCSWVKLKEQITLQQGSALSLPFQAETFDGAYMMHVGMNIEDKAQLFTGIFRVLRPGAVFGVYDVMRTKDGELIYPVPWATERSISKLATPNQYKEALTAAGFRVASDNNRRDFAINFLKELLAKTEAQGGPPPLGLHILMKASARVKVKNLSANITAGLVAPVEIIAQKA
jgi:ubiquinone/menaquinone biosynthesis C-methylase UbiE